MLQNLTATTDHWLPGQEATQDGEHHEEQDADHEVTKNQAEQFSWAKFSYNIVADYWMEPLAEIHCFSTD